MDLNTVTSSINNGNLLNTVGEYFNQFKKFNIINIFMFFRDNPYVDIAGINIPSFVILIVALLILTWIARKLKAIGWAIVFIAIIAFFNTLIIGI